MRIKTDEEIKRVEQSIKKAYYSICGTLEGANDCAQHIFKNFLEGKSSHQPIRFAILDYLALKQNRRPLTQDLDDVGYDPTPAIYSMYQLRDILDSIENKVDRAFLILYYRWGLTTGEIGETFGVDQSWVSMRLSDLRIKIQERLKEREI